MMPFHTKPAAKLGAIVVLMLFFSISMIIFHGHTLQQKKIYGKTNELPTLEEEATIQSFNEKQGFPVRMKIPAIGVDASIQHVGFNSEGEMDVPDNTDQLGWFAFGPRPGEKGSAVIAGHLYGEDGTPGVFADLSKVVPGDTIYIDDSKGNSISFMVKEQRTYSPGFVFNVFNLTDKPYLNLVTCDGDWDITKESYTKRLVVFTEITY